MSLIDAAEKLFYKIFYCNYNLLKLNKKKDSLEKDINEKQNEIADIEINEKNVNQRKLKPLLILMKMKLLDQKKNAIQKEINIEIKKIDKQNPCCVII